MSAPPSKREAERKIGQAIYRAMKRNRSALIQGAPLKGEKTLIDGTFDLCQVAASVLKVIKATDGEQDHTSEMEPQMRF